MYTKNTRPLLLMSLLLSVMCGTIQGQTFKWAKTGGASTYYTQGEDMVTDSMGNTYSTGSFSGTVDFDPSPSSVFNLTAATSPNNKVNVFILKLDSLGNFIWAKNIGGNGYNYSKCVKLTWDGLIVCGKYSGITDFNPSTNLVMNITAKSAYEGFILKLNFDGDFMWTQQFAQDFTPNPNFDFESIDIDRDYNIILTGTFSNRFDFSPGFTSYLDITAIGNTDAYILKLTSTGNIIFAKNIGSIGKVVTPNSVAVDANNNIYLTGTYDANTLDLDPSFNTFFVNKTSTRDLFLAKYSSNGSFIWGKSMGCNDTTTALSGNTSYLERPTVYIKGKDLYLASTFNDTIDVDFSAATNYLYVPNYGGNLFLAKYDTAAQFKWAKQIKGNVISLMGDNDIILDKNENIYLAGVFYYNVDFDPSPTTAYNVMAFGNGSDCFILKLDSLGIFKWVQNFGATESYDNASGIGIDKAGSIYTSGYFSGTCAFDPSSSTSNKTAIGLRDYYVTKFSQNIILPLNLLSFNAIFQSKQVLTNWQTTNEINVSHFTVQRSTNGSSFTDIGNVTATGGGNYSYTDGQLPNAATIYYRLQMVDKDGSYTYSKVVAINLNSKFQTLNLYPNPVRESLFVQVTSTKSEKLTLQVTDLQGRILQQEDTQVGIGNVSLSVNTSGLAKGTYVLLVKGSGSAQQKQFIKE